MESLRRDTNRGSSPLCKDPMGSRQVSSEEWRRKTCTSHGTVTGSSEVCPKGTGPAGGQQEGSRTRETEQQHGGGGGAARQKLRVVKARSFLHNFLFLQVCAGATTKEDTVRALPCLQSHFPKHLRNASSSSHCSAGSEL